MKHLKTYKTFEGRVHELSILGNESDINDDIELMKDMLSDIEDFDTVQVCIEMYAEKIEILINRDYWKNETFKLSENIHSTINNFRKYFKSLGYNIEMSYMWHFESRMYSHDHLWISDDEFLDHNHKGINNKDVIGILIRLT